MWNIEDAAVAAAHSVSPGRWWDGFGEVMDRIGSRFVRYEPRRHAAAMMLGLLSGLDRKNCWTIAEHRRRRGSATAWRGPPARIVTDRKRDKPPCSDTRNDPRGMTESPNPQGRGKVSFMLLSDQPVILASSVSKYGGGLGGLIIVLILAFICSRIAASKGRRPALWFIIGFFFPLLGIILALVLPRKG